MIIAQSSPGLLLRNLMLFANRIDPSKKRSTATVVNNELGDVSDFYLFETESLTRVSRRSPEYCDPRVLAPCPSTLQKVLKQVSQELGRRKHGRGQDKRPTEKFCPTSLSFVYNITPRKVEAKGKMYLNRFPKNLGGGSMAGDKTSDRRRSFARPVSHSCTIKHHGK